MNISEAVQNPVKVGMRNHIFLLQTSESRRLSFFGPEQMMLLLEPVGDVGV